MTLQRYLDDIEARHLNAAPAHAAEYVGVVDEEVLSRAFELISARHPVLRARITPDKGRHLLQVPPEHRPEFRIVDGDEQTLLQEVLGPWDAGRAVAHLILVRAGDRGYIALRVDHAVMDGHSFRAMFDELLRMYHDLARGISVKVEQIGSLPCPPSKLLQERWGGNSAVDVAAPVNSRQAGPPQFRRVRPVQGYLRFTAAETARLLAFARVTRTSVHALVSGSILAAHRNHGASADGLAQILCLSPVNLRQRVVPPVGTTETTIFLGIHIADVAVAPNCHPVTVGAEVKAQVHDAISRRQVPLSVDLPTLSAKSASSSLERRLALVQVSNNGILHPDLPQLPGLQIVDFLMPTDAISTAFPIYSIYTYARRLSIRYLYPSTVFTTEEVQTITDGVGQQLARCCPPV
ncbi:condensation domain-containing protein [Saccharomonospora sp. NPDC046836]|uniref:phthiocerol/phthiodiolone dimycocerosyl transferase family protein n=1 Tax=Saccharomonospora sp. NPDC046836 TaxID=3156921 RepID=UPI0033D4743B